MLGGVRHCELLISDSSQGCWAALERATRRGRERSRGGDRDGQGEERWARLSRAPSERREHSGRYAVKTLVSQIRER